MSSVGKLMRQAQRIQQQMESVQVALAQKSIETSAGGGTVCVTFSGDGSITAIKINPDAVSKDDMVFLEELILKAVNEGISKARELSSKEMGSVTQGFAIPGMF
jgi:nucleoid-associated protein EbfC